MTSWHGHRGDASLPRVVKEVWDEKFRPQSVRPPAKQSNVDMVLLKSNGEVVYWFDAFQRSDFETRETLAQYTVREIQKGSQLLGLPKASDSVSKIKLPDVGKSSGMRVFVRLKDSRMKAYQIPVVEAVKLQPQDWVPLKWSDQECLVDAGSLRKWLQQLYPPGIMERTDPQTKEIFKINTVEGILSLIPAGSDGRQRYAVLSGVIQFGDEGADGFNYNGQIELVLTYTMEKPEVQTVRGVFEGTYPRFDRIHNRSYAFPLEAAFESLPR